MAMKRVPRGEPGKRPHRDARLPPTQRRAQLMACALRVFAEHGIGAGNHALVAAAAGVAIPTVFFYFNTREKLVDAVLSEVEQLVGSTFEDAMRDERPADVVLLQLIRKEAQALETHPYHVRVFFEWGVAVRAAIWPRFLRLDRRMLSVVTRLIERGQREGCFRSDVVPEDEAQILHAASRVLSQMKLAGAPQARIDRFQHSMFQITLYAPAAGRPARGVRKRSQPAGRRRAPR